MLLDYRDAAARLNISERTVRRLVAGGQLTAVRVGRLVRIEEAAIAAYVRSRRTTNVEPKEEPSTPGQRSALGAKAAALEQEHGWERGDGKKHVKGYASERFDREITSLTQLTRGEASDLLDWLDEQGI